MNRQKVRIYYALLPFAFFLGFFLAPSGAENGTRTRVAHE